MRTAQYSNVPKQLVLDQPILHPWIAERVVSNKQVNRASSMVARFLEETYYTLDARPSQVQYPSTRFEQERLPSENTKLWREFEPPS